MTDEFRDLKKDPDYEGRHFQVRDLGWLVKIRHTILTAAREYLYQDGLLEVQTPVLTSLTGACEDMSTLFEVPYFDQRAFLRQTSQLHLETFIYGEETPHVYTVGQSFRKEPRSDGRHLTEFGLIEVEGRDYDLSTLIDMMKGLVTYIVSQVIEHNSADLKKTKAKIDELANIVFAQMTYAEAVKKLKEGGHKIEFGDDLNQEAERLLTGYFGPLIVTHYPGKIKFFNMKENEDDPDLVNCCDLLLPIAGEVIGGSERLESWDRLAEKLHDPSMMEQFERIGGNCLEFKWYLDLRRGNPLPHGGFGLGIERLVQFVAGLTDIREAALYARDSKNLHP
jgi:asparaginyl-tRNA synthetase